MTTTTVDRVVDRVVNRVVDAVRPSVVAVVAALGAAFLIPPLALASGRVAVAVGVVLTGLFLVLSRLRPELLVAAVIALSLTTLTAGFPLGTEVGGISVTVYDLLLVVALLVASRRPPLGRVGPLLPVVALAAAVGIVLGSTSGASVNAEVGEARSLLYLLAGLVLSRHTSSGEVLRQGSKVAVGILWASLLVVLANLAVGVSIAASEAEAHLAQGTGGAGTTAIVFSAKRYVTVTTHFAVFVVAALLCYAALPPGRRQLRAHAAVVVALLVPATLLTVLSFSRNTLLGLAAALLFTLVATRSFASYLALAAKTATAVAALVLLGLLLFPSSTHDVAETYAGRVLAGTSLGSLEADSGVQFRRIESDLAIESIEHHPWLGIGFGSTYRPDLAQDPFPPSSSEYARGYVHNWYLWLATKLGVLGAIPVVVLFALALMRALVGSHDSIVLGSGLAAIIAIGVVWSTLRDPGMALVIGLVTGCLVHGRTAATIRSGDDRPTPVRLPALSWASGPDDADQDNGSDG